MSTTYTATAAREGRWWVLTVDGIGVTQSRTLKDAPDAARGLISAMLDVDPNEIDVNVIPQVSSDVLDRVDGTRKAVVALQAMQHKVATESRAVVRDLEREGLTGADIAYILNVSPQRVSQLLAPAPPVIGEVAHLKKARRKSTVSR